MSRSAATMLSDSACTTRASGLGNWTAGTGELTGKLLDDDLDYDALLGTLCMHGEEDGEEDEEGGIFEERQIAALVRVARLRENGFFMTELSKVEKVLEFALRKVQEEDGAQTFI